MIEDNQYRFRPSRGVEILMEGEKFGKEVENEIKRIF